MGRAEESSLKKWPKAESPVVGAIGVTNTQTQVSSSNHAVSFGDTEKSRVLGGLGGWMRDDPVVAHGKRYI